MSLLKLLIFSFIIFASCTLGAFFFIAQQPWVDFSILDYYNPGKPSIVYDETGVEWTRFQFDKREIITIQEIPQHVIDAFLAAEDWNFFKHNGISLKGILRSFLVNMYHRKKIQGASTITQQLAKLLFFSPTKSYSRKIKEQFIALIIERQFTKEHILETYLNHVCFGCGIYGVQAASQRFWGKSVTDITIDEAATLAGIVRCPTNYCPLTNSESAKIRRNIVLRTMHTLKLIPDELYEQAKLQPLTIVKPDQTTAAPHLRESVRMFLENLVGKQKLYSGGLKIQATLNLRIQEAAELHFNNEIGTLKETITPDIDGALIALGTNGAIRALVGGYDFKLSKFNRAMHGRRQMGSTIKPLIYAAALQAGRSLVETEVDEPLTIQDNSNEWSPRNFNHAFLGSMTLAYALSISNNIIAIKSLLNVGAEKVIALAQQCGIQGPLLPYPSLALGCVDGTAYEAAAMMHVFAHNGTYSEPYLIEWVKDEWNTKIWKHKQRKQLVLSSSISSQIAKALTLSIERLKRKATTSWLDCQAFGKTGTTNDARTCWFTGSTPSLTTSVYIGCDDNRSLGDQAYAIRTAFPLWLEFNKAIESKVKEFSFEPSLREITVNAKTGWPCSDTNPDAITLLAE